MLQYAPILGRRLSLLMLAPFLVLGLLLRLRRFQRRTCRAISASLGLGAARSFALYLRSLFGFSAFNLDYTIMCARGVDEIERRMRDVTVIGRPHLERALATGQPVLVTTMHMGDFQLGFLKLVEQLRPDRLLSVFKLSARSRSEDVLFQAFAKFGYQPNAMRAGDGGGRQAYLALRKGHVVAITIDLELQVTSRSVVQFFGRPCHMQNGPATIAALTKSVIVPIVNYTDSAGRHIVRIEPPIDAASRDAGEGMPAFIHRLTQQLAQTLEAWISIDPGQVHAWTAIAETIACPLPEDHVQEAQPCAA